MKIIVIAGAKRKIGKTTTLRIIQSFFPTSVAVKLGKKGEIDKQKPELLFDYEAEIKDIVAFIGYQPSYMLIEGNSMLHKVKPDLSFFVDCAWDDPERKSYADQDKSLCDLVIGGEVDLTTLISLANNIAIPVENFMDMLHQLTIRIKDTDKA